jgi:predicted small lipoprotein YifL
MRAGVSRYLFLVIGILLALAGCGRKTPQEIEAEKAKADAAWDAQTAVAERAREQEEKRLVDQEIAAHEQKEKADEEREQRAEQSGDGGVQKTLMDSVRAKFADPQAVRFANLGWIARSSALCGEVSARDEKSVYAAFKRFVATPDATNIDADDGLEHTAYMAAAGEAGCPP